MTAKENDRGEEQSANMKPICTDNKEQNMQPRVQVRTFGEFTVSVNGEPVVFARTRAKELLAYLIDRQGSSVTRSSVFAALYGDALYDRSMQKQLDVMIRSLMETLRRYDIEDVLEKQGGYLRVRPERIDCDMYRFFAGDEEAIRAFHGEYMTGYAWAGAQSLEAEIGSLLSYKPHRAESVSVGTKPVGARAETIVTGTKPVGSRAESIVTGAKPVGAGTGSVSAGAESTAAGADPFDIGTKPVHAEAPRRFEVKCFGGFDLLVDGSTVTFPRSKAKELLACLVDRRGREITRRNAFAILWEDRYYDRSAQKYFDNIVHCLLTTLEENGAREIVEAGRGTLRLRPEKVVCDFYSFLDGDAGYLHAFRGEYMSDYSWASVTEAFVESEKTRRISQAEKDDGALSLADLEQVGGGMPAPGSYRPGAYRDEALAFFRSCVGDETYALAMGSAYARRHHNVAASAFLSPADWERFVWVEQHGCLDGFPG